LKDYRLDILGILKNSEIHKGSKKSFIRDLDNQYIDDLFRSKKELNDDEAHGMEANITKLQDDF
jgi:hypothetical protein